MLYITGDRILIFFFPFFAFWDLSNSIDVATAGSTVVVAVNPRDIVQFITLSRESVRDQPTNWRYESQHVCNESKNACLISYLTIQDKNIRKTISYVTLFFYSNTGWNLRWFRKFRTFVLFYRYMLTRAILSVTCFEFSHNKCLYLNINFDEKNKKTQDK